MSDCRQEFAELHDLLEAVCEDSLSESQTSRLHALLKNSRDMRLEYLRAINVHGTLSWDLGGENRAETPAVGETSLIASDASARNAVANAPPAPCHFSNPFAQTTEGAFSLFSGWPVAYLIASVVFGLGLLVGSLVHVSQPAQIVLPSPIERGIGGEGDTRLPSPFGRGAGGEGSYASSIVGRITGMVDCRWETEGLGIGDSGLDKAAMHRGQETGNNIQKSEIRNRKSWST